MKKIAIIFIALACVVGVQAREKTDSSTCLLEKASKAELIEMLQKEQRTNKKLNDTIKKLNQQISQLNKQIAEIDTSITHLEDKVIRDYVVYSCRLPYNQFAVARAIKAYPQIKDNVMREDLKESYTQLKTYYDLANELLAILRERQTQIASPTFNKSRWTRKLTDDLDALQAKGVNKLIYIREVIDKVKKESEKSVPNFQSMIKELSDALN